ncbi:hypothetical protein CPB86DRAFT_271265 [Serendipita vermifera]|nr:hypothetical protein CPB86DRAFT_271265 [Serendipita vermifera]
MDERRDHDTVPLTYQPSLTSNAALSPSISAVHFSRTPTPPLRYHRTVEGSTSSATSPYRQSIPNSELPSEYSHSPIFSSGSTSERLREAGKMVWLRFFISFRRKWNKAVISRSRGPRIVYTMVGLGFVGMWISVVFIFVKERPPLKPFGSGDRPFSHENIIQNPNSVYWNLEGTLQQFDHVRRTLSR